MNRSTARVDEYGGLLHQPELARPEHPACGTVERHVDRHDIADPQQVIQLDRLRTEFPVSTRHHFDRVVVQHFAIEPRQPARNLPSDVPETDNANRLATDLGPHRQLVNAVAPVSAHRVCPCFHHPAVDAQDQAHRMLRHRYRVGTAVVRNADSELAQAHDIGSVVAGGQ